MDVAKRGATRRMTVKSARLVKLMMLTGKMTAAHKKAALPFGSTAPTSGLSLF